MSDGAVWITLAIAAILLVHGTLFQVCADWLGNGLNLMAEGRFDEYRARRDNPPRHIRYALWWIEMGNRERK